MKSIDELKDEIHEIAKSKGWHDDTERDTEGRPTARQMLAWIALVTDELDEADDESVAEYVGENGKPEGHLNEIVDARIWCLDIAGACGFELGNNVELARDVFCVSHDAGICRVRSSAVSSVRNGDVAGTLFSLSRLIVAVEMEFCSRSPRLDWELHMDELTRAKCAYNRTRPHRHGGKLA